MSKIPVFDIGDTLVPDFRLMNRAVREVLRDAGYNHIPVFEINKYNIYREKDIEEFLEFHGLEADEAEVKSRFLKYEEEFLSESGVVKLLEKCGKELGPIGIISDNSIEAREIWKKFLESSGVPYRGFKVSEEVGVKKSDIEIFQEFLDERDRPAEDFVYFGNHAGRDKGAEKVGMDFVWVKQYYTFGTNHDGKTIERLELDSIKRYCQ